MISHAGYPARSGPEEGHNPKLAASGQAHGTNARASETEVFAMTGCLIRCLSPDPLALTE
jgi:hypothetical protein